MESRALQTGNGSRKTRRARSGTNGARQRAVERASHARRIRIENVVPRLAGGRYAVKRIVGDTFEVGADVLRDGHEVLGARICYRVPGEPRWRFAPMRSDPRRDRWTGTFRLQNGGRFLYTVEAWVDVFATWQRDLEKRVEAGADDLRPELEVGRELLLQAASRAAGTDRELLEGAAAVLHDGATAAREVARTVLDRQLSKRMRIYGERRDGVRFGPPLSCVVDRKRARCAAWYEMFPRSQGPEPGRPGTFADAERSLQRIAALGFDVVYLPPVHPIGRTNRKGRNNGLAAQPGDPGSPWAIGNAEGGHTSVDPGLGTLEDFEHFVQTARTFGMEVALDYALQCSPDHPWVREHPEWFFVRPDGSIRHAENPPKKYEDIFPLDLWCENRAELWQACLDVLLFWIARGVRTFRVDNPHTKPFPFWEWLIGTVKREHPDVILLSEAFTRPMPMKTLAKIGFTQSYSYFTWRNTARELREYFQELTQTEMAEYFRPNLFTNTPDILSAYLQEGGGAAFRVRLLLAATLSPLYGIYSGFELCENVPLGAGSEEYLNSEKYEIRWRDWNAPGNINEDIAKINRIRRENWALQLFTNLRFHESENEQILFYEKSIPGGKNDLFIAVNLDPHTAQEGMLHVPIDRLGLGPNDAYPVEDLLTGVRYTWRGVRNYVRLDPSRQVGHVLRVVRERKLGG
ncbi:MAG: alpha-1,4-glucan--maltose-1-phosphate maltosyltransferase [Candidatus Krumholzibacteriia bacterium]